MSRANLVCFWRWNIMACKRCDEVSGRWTFNGASEAFSRTSPSISGSKASSKAGSKDSSPAPAVPTPSRCSLDLLLHLHPRHTTWFSVLPWHDHRRRGSSPVFSSDSTHTPAASSGSATWYVHRNQACALQSSSDGIKYFSWHKSFCNWNTPKHSHKVGNSIRASIFFWASAALGRTVSCQYCFHALGRHRMDFLVLLASAFSARFLHPEMWLCKDPADCLFHPCRCFAWKAWTEAIWSNSFCADLHLHPFQLWNLWNQAETLCPH